MHLSQRQGAFGGFKLGGMSGGCAPNLRSGRNIPTVRSAKSLATAAAKGDAEVICVGEALFDFLANQKGVKRDKVTSWDPHMGGAPCNVATCMARLGVPTTFVSALGRDERGEQLMKVLAERGVDTTSVQRLDSPTRDVYVERSEDGDREFAGFGLPTDQYCDCFLDAGKLPLDKIRNASVVVFGTLGLAYPATRAAMYAAADAARAGGTNVLIDVNWRPVFWEGSDAEPKATISDFLERADIVKISDADFEYLYGVSMEAGLKDPCALAAKLPKARGVLVTAGGDGAAYCFRTTTKAEHSGMVPVLPVKVTDTTGAGDAFTAGFLIKLLEAGGVDGLATDPRKLKEAVVFAAATGGLTTTKPGAIGAQPTLQEVQELFEKSKGLKGFWDN